MRLRVATYNILNGGSGREAQLIEVLASVGADVIVLQEAYDNGLVPRLGTALGMEAVVETSNSSRRVALLSRLPVRSVANHRRFPPIGRNVLVATVELSDRRTVRVIGLHPVASLWFGFELWRWWEAQYALRLAAPYEAHWCLLAGDLNAIAPGDRVGLAEMPLWLKWTLRTQGGRAFGWSISAYGRGGLTDTYRHLHPTEDGFTLPADRPNARLDFIFANGTLLPFLTLCEVVDSPSAVLTASDHRPLVAEFVFPE